jgi:hypothetical protein
LHPEIGADGVTVPGNGTTIPCARRLVITDFWVQRDILYFSDRF